MLYGRIKQLSLSTPRNIFNFRVKKLQSPLFFTSSSFFPKFFSSVFDDEKNLYQKKLRNVGISAHIDSGKTTLTERILYYTGRIKEIHEVKGKDGVGATMDFMELEREKGITIQSAATYAHWGDNRINIIDTPGHVDFTIEVERALRVLDGAILVLCGVSGVQSQTITVDRQMKRYQIPRVIFINKLDRAGADPWRVLDQIIKKLNLNSAAVQIPIGIENNLKGIIDIIKMKAYYFEGSRGDSLIEKEIPGDLKSFVEEKRSELIEKIGDIDDVIGEKIVEEKPISIDDLKSAIRRLTISRKFIPAFLGSALKNTGIQLLLDGVIDYLPNPTEVENKAINLTNNEPILLSSDITKPFVGLAFKLEESRHGQLTYMRVYQGAISRGSSIVNMANNKKIKVPRLVRMHANQMEEIQSIGAGEICALFGVECASGTTFAEDGQKVGLTSMHVPDAVMSLAVSPKKRDQNSSFSKALQRFQKEDPTFRVHLDQESGQTIISGMGELHLEIYIERMRREYDVETNVGKPEVAYRETIGKKTHFEYLHKKQSGGAGQYAKIIGYYEPIPIPEGTVKKIIEFENAIVGANVPPNYVPAIEKGFQDVTDTGSLTNHPVTGVRMVVTDGGFHPVDSSEMAFRICSNLAFREAFKNANPQILEPVMTVEITIPAEFQGVVISQINKRKGVILETIAESDFVTFICEVPLNNMFGYSTDLRSVTQGKGEFVMEYKKHAPVSKDAEESIIQYYKKKKEEQAKK